MKSRPTVRRSLVLDAGLDKLQAFTGRKVVIGQALTQELVDGLSQTRLGDGLDWPGTGLTISATAHRMGDR